MIRKTLTILSLLGLLLSAVLWGVSYWNIKWGINASTAYVGLSRGAVIASGFVDVDGVVEWDMETMWSGFDGFTTHWIPSYHETPHSAPDPQYTVWGFVFPLYIPLTASGLVFAWLLPHHRRRERKKLGLCVKCGYDLRGSKDRCPECNTPFDPAKLGQVDLRSWRAKFLGALTHYSSLVVPLLMIFCVLMAFVIGSCLP